jgi:hypothetical protein
VKAPLSRAWLLWDWFVSVFARVNQVAAMELLAPNP